MHITTGNSIQNFILSDPYFGHMRVIPRDMGIDATVIACILLVYLIGLKGYLSWGQFILMPQVALKSNYKFLLYYCSIKCHLPVRDHSGCSFGGGRKSLFLSSFSCI